MVEKPDDELCPKCGASCEPIEIERDCWSYGGAGRSEGHYTVHTGWCYACDCGHEWDCADAPDPDEAYDRKREE